MSHARPLLVTAVILTLAASARATVIESAFNEALHPVAAADVSGLEVTGTASADPSAPPAGADVSRPDPAATSSGPSAAEVLDACWVALDQWLPLNAADALAAALVNAPAEARAAGAVEDAAVAAPVGSDGADLSSDARPEVSTGDGFAIATVDTSGIESPDLSAPAATPAPSAVEMPLAPPLVRGSTSTDGLGMAVSAPAVEDGFAGGADADAWTELASERHRHWSDATVEFGGAPRSGGSTLAAALTVALLVRGRPVCARV